VDRIADVEGTQPVALASLRPHCLHADESLDVVAVRATLERRQRRERQAPDGLELRQRNRDELREPRRDRVNRLAAVGEEGEVPRLLQRGLGDSFGWRVAVDADEQAGSAA